uniref:Integrase catalytic domain-containing protein n=1 Tax=Anopheles stephensi TaxID=30069 RepID=A0A182YRW2_ANOST
MNNIENMKRLMDSLGGEALEAVKGRLIFPDAVPGVIKELESRFGRPRKLLENLLRKVRETPSPTDNHLESFITFGFKVKQLCDHLVASNMTDHQNNPFLVEELIDKLPPRCKVEWVRFKRDKEGSVMAIFGEYIQTVIDEVSEVTDCTPVSSQKAGKYEALKQRSRPVKSNAVQMRNNVHDLENSGVNQLKMTCWVCSNTGHSLKECDQFKEMTLVDRFKTLEKLKISSPGTVIYRTMPITLYAERNSVDVIAFIDEGSSGTLLEAGVAKRLNVTGPTEPLVISWTNSIKREEHDSKRFSLKTSAQGSSERWNLLNVRTVSELLLPKPKKSVAEVIKKYKHLSDVPVLDHPNEAPSMIIGLDNIDLFAALETRIGNRGEPIAVRSKLGWTVYGVDGYRKQNEYDKSEKLLMRVAQSECFVDEIKVLTKNMGRPSEQWMSLDKGSPLYKLSPLLDEDGLIRMEGRTEQAKFLPFSLRFPVILPDKHPITESIVRHYHERSGHGYREAVKNELRRAYFIIHLDATVRRVSSACVWCKVHRNRPKVPRMAPLPVQRLTPFLRPFSFTGVDYLGPFTVTVGRRSEKRWIVLFTCLVVRAVHLEVASELTTQSCMMAIRRFVCRRGWPMEFLSDNGTNFQGASKLIVTAIDEDCADQMTNARTKWTFNPPAAPHMGGVWERLVRSVKDVLKALDDGRRLTDEILQTSVLEAEDIINSRPLVTVSQHGSDEETLTPNHFLRGVHGRDERVVPPTNPKIAMRDTYERSQQLADLMWEKWVKEYAPTLNQRKKWFGDNRSLGVGDLVYVVDGKCRKQWVRGIVEEVIKAGDGRVRQVWVRTQNGRFKRAVHNLAVLEVE